LAVIPRRRIDPKRLALAAKLAPEIPQVSPVPLPKGAAPPPGVKRARGRPKGSKNKPKTIS
jgi:hypothetical protein